MAVSADDITDDARLVLAVQAGDTDAYAELFRRHYPAVRRACARRLRDVAEADEVAQAAFVRALERIDRCGGERRFGAWVQVIAQRLCIDAMRASARTTPRADPLAGEREVGPNTPEDRALDADRASTLRAALATLPPRQRDIVIARDLHDRRPPEIAAAFGLSIGAVDSLLLRARRRLAGAYKAAAGEQGISTAASSAAVASGTVAAGNRGLVDAIAAGVRAVRDVVVNVPSLASAPAAAPIAASPAARRTAAATVAVVLTLVGAGGGPTTHSHAPVAVPAVPAVRVPSPPPAVPSTPVAPQAPDLAGLVGILPAPTPPDPPPLPTPPSPPTPSPMSGTMPLPLGPTLSHVADAAVANAATTLDEAVTGATSTVDTLGAFPAVVP